MRPQGVVSSHPVLLWVWFRRIRFCCGRGYMGVSCSSRSFVGVVSRFQSNANMSFAGDGESLVVSRQLSLSIISSSGIPVERKRKKLYKGSPRKIFYTVIFFHKMWIFNWVYSQNVHFYIHSFFFMLSFPAAACHRSLPSTCASIPSKYRTYFKPCNERKGFNCQTMRFSTEPDNDLPGPGHYPLLQSSLTAPGESLSKVCVIMHDWSTDLALSLRSCNDKLYILYQSSLLP